MPRKKKATTKTVKPAVEKVTPVNIPTADMPDLSTEVFRISDRLQHFISGETKSMGASCNTHKVGDSLAAIARAATWAITVSGYQGAPSLELSDLRARGSAVNSGGDSSGAASFGQIFDGIIGSMRRPTKKNGAGVVWLDCFHGDLDEFLQADYKYTFRGVYLPRVSDTAGNARLLKDKALVEKLAKAYNENRIFLCKRPELSVPSSSELFLNLCTEIEIPHQGFCILGVINLSQFTLNTIHTLSGEFRKAASDMYSHMQRVLDANRSHDVLKCTSPANRQFGLGVSGLASLLANTGVTYVEYTEALKEAVKPGSHSTIEQIAFRAAKEAQKSGAHLLVAEIVRAYADVASTMKGKVDKCFCIQPSATGAYQCADSSGFHSTPEIQPAIGIRDRDGVHTIRKSAMLGNQKIVFHPAVETINDVSYECYDELAALWQEMMTSTGLAHRHSTCWYGEEFKTADLAKFVQNQHRLNLYYRLQSYNEVALNKSQVGEGLAAEDDFNPDDLLGESCGIQTKGSVECECAA